MAVSGPAPMSDVTTARCRFGRPAGSASSVCVNVAKLWVSFACSGSIPSEVATMDRTSTSREVDVEKAPCSVQTPLPGGQVTRNLPTTVPPVPPPSAFPPPFPPVPPPSVDRPLPPQPARTDNHIKTHEVHRPVHDI